MFEWVEDLKCAIGVPPQCLSTVPTPTGPTHEFRHLQRSDQHVSTQHATTYVADAPQLALAAGFYVCSALVAGYRYLRKQCP
jgi:hypothetical protein